MRRKNIHLDFLNPDYINISGLRALSGAERRRTLVGLINVSVFLCKTCCYVPPGFLLLTAENYKICVACKVYFEHDLIKLPMRELNLASLIDKKKNEYEHESQIYQHLYKQSHNLKIMNGSVVPRRSKIGSFISNHWMAGPDIISARWGDIKQIYTSAQIDKIRRLPHEIVASGSACTFPAVCKFSGAGILKDDLFRLLQESHNLAYIKEFDSVILKNAPYFASISPIDDNSNIHDYQALKSALGPLGVWEAIIQSSPETMTSLRETVGYYDFCQLFVDTQLIDAEYRAINELFVKAKQVIFSGRQHSCENPSLISDEYEKADVISKTLQAAAVFVKDSGALRHNSLKMIRRGACMDLAIFTALEFEKEILSYRWDLKSDGNQLSWSSEVCGKKITVYSPLSMGRVSAAISTMKFLRYCEENKSIPKLIMTVGIAGGFSANGVTSGDVLVATDVIDMSLTKVIGESKEHQYRPVVHKLSDEINKLRYSDFKQDEWAIRVCRKEGPFEGKGWHPSIHYGELLSVDEVIASQEHTQKYLDQFPKLLGVDMETSGVVPAAKEFGIDVLAFRGVSDQADPRKSDNAWRTTSMKIVADFIEIFLEKL
jgi:nucleoside phosphorylase